MGGGLENIPQEQINMPEQTTSHEVEPDRDFADLLMEPEVFGPIIGGLTVTVIGPIIFYFIKRKWLHGLARDWYSKHFDNNAEANEDA